MRFRKHARHTVYFTLNDLLSLLKGQIRGHKIEVFEKQFANFIGTQYAVALPSCRFGLYHYLKLLNLNEHDEVIMPAYTFEALPFAILANGAQVKYVDTHNSGFNVDIKAVLENISPQTKAVLVSHLYGKSCDMSELTKVCHEQGIKIIEDCAHACGTSYEDKRVGSIGTIGLFSFGVGKGLNANGGGMLTTNSKEIYTRFKELVSSLPERNFGEIFFGALKTYFMSLMTRPLIFSSVTYNLIRLTSLKNADFFDELVNEKVTLDSFVEGLKISKKFNDGQASLGLKKLEELRFVNETMRENASRYDSTLPRDLLWGDNNLKTGEFPSYYVIRHSNRKQFRLALLKYGIDTKSCDMNVCPALTHPDTISKYPGSLKVHNELFEIPNNSGLKLRDLEYISAKIRECAEEIS